MDVFEFLKVAGIAGALVGVVMAIVALIAAVASFGDAAVRQRALGFVLLGMSVSAASAAVFLISRLGITLPLIAGLPPIGLMIVLALGLRLAALRSFRQSREARPR